METKSEQVIEVLKIHGYITRTELNKVCKHSRLSCGVINSVMKKGHQLKIERDPITTYPIKYIYKGYLKPFYMIARDIELNYPKIEKTIRNIYNLISK